MGIVSAANPIGEVLGGRYRVLRRLGTGGMGTVYLAEHVLLGRLCAVKVLCPPLCDDDPSVEQRFRQEALLVASVRHPGIAQVYDFDRGPDGRFLLAMEYVEGETVAQRLRRDGPFALPEAIGVLRIVGDALRSEEHTSELQSQSNLVCRLLLEKKIATSTFLRSESSTYAPVYHPLVITPSHFRI